MLSFEEAFVQPDETLSRFVFDRSYFRIADGTLKYAAFMPRSGDLGLSVFRTSGMEESAVWKIGEDVGQESRRVLQGRGDIVVAAVRGQGLDVDADNEPPRHANIAGWPEEKDKRMEIAQVLASRSIPRLLAG